MEAFVNDRYVRLQATNPRYVQPASVKRLLLSSTTLVVKFGTGAPSPVSATLNAGLLGITGVATWQITGGELTGTADNTRTLAASSITGETVTITATVVENGVPYDDTITITKVSDGSGARGAGHYYVGGSSWSDTVADAATPGGNVTDDVVTIYNNSVKFAESKRWDGDSWEPISGVMDGTMLIDGGIELTKFASSIEPIKLVEAVPTEKSTSTIFNTLNGKLYRWNGTIYTAATPATDISGQLLDTQIAAVQAAKIQGLLTNDQLAAIAAAKLTGQISSVQIADDSITSPKIAANAVTASEIEAGAVVADKIAANAVTANKIAANTILAKHMVLRNSDAVDPDPGFDDPSFWTNGGAAYPANVWVSGDANAPVGRGLVFDPGSDVFMESRFFTIDKSAVYRMKVTIFKANGTAGNFAIGLHIPGIVHHELNIPRTSTNVAWGGNRDLNWGQIPNGWFSYESVVSSPARDEMNYYLTGEITAGQLIIAFQLTRMADAKLVVDGSITAVKIAANTITANEIAANAITASELAADSVTVGKVAAGAIRAREVAAGAITTSKLAVVPESICPDPYFNDFAWWSEYLNDSNSWYPENRVPGSGNVPDTMGSPRCATLSLADVGTDRRHLWSRWTPFAGRGQILRFRARMFNNSGQWAICALRFHNSQGTVTADHNNLMPAYGGVSNMGLQCSVPDDCAAISFICYNQSGFASGGYIGISEVKLDIAATGELIVDGAITASKISVSSLSIVSPNIGLLRQRASGGRMELEDDRQRIYDGTGALRVKVGYLL